MIKFIELETRIIELKDAKIDYFIAFYEQFHFLEKYNRKISICQVRFSFGMIRLIFCVLSCTPLPALLSFPFKSCAYDTVFHKYRPSQAVLYGFPLLQFLFPSKPESSLRSVSS